MTRSAPARTSPISRASTARSQDGRGLGLAIVHAIVSEHHGTVTIENRAGGNGTIATITIPGPRAR